MTFTRASDSTALEPITVFGPYVNEIPTRTTARLLMESTDVRVVYHVTGRRTGEFMLLFASYGEAYAGAVWFSDQCPYVFDGSSVPGGLIQVGGYVEEGPGTPGPSDGGLITDGGYIEEGPGFAEFALDFVVTGGALTIRQNAPLYELVVPFQEIEGP